jgi:mannose-6-phosphate isomerase-like protein (cupin superfamily)
VVSKKSIAEFFHRYNDIFNTFVLFGTKLLQKKKKYATIRAESRGEKRMEKKFIVTKISHIIMVGDEEYPEKKTSFSHDLRHHELIFSLRGRATVFFNGERMETEKGTVRFLPAGHTEQYEVVRQENGACIDIFFDTDFPISEKAFVMNPKQSEKLECLFK